jgi:hypothetical protein
MLIQASLSPNKKLLTHLGLSEKPIKGAKVCLNHVPWIQVLRHSRGFDNLIRGFTSSSCRRRRFMSSQERRRFSTKDGDVEALEVLDFCS